MTNETFRFHLTTPKVLLQVWLLTGFQRSSYIHYRREGSLPPLTQEVCLLHGKPTLLLGLGLRHASSPIAKVQMGSRPKEKLKGTALGRLWTSLLERKTCKLPWHVEPDTLEGNVLEVCSKC